MYYPWVDRAELRAVEGRGFIAHNLVTRQMREAESGYGPLELSRDDITRLTCDIMSAVKRCMQMRASVVVRAERPASSNRLALPRPLAVAPVGGVVSLTMLVDRDMRKERVDLGVARPRNSKSCNRGCVRAYPICSAARL